MGTGLKLLRHLLFVALLFVAAVFLFRSVATLRVAVGIAAVLTLGELVVLIGTGRHGGGIRTLLAIGWPALVFPIVGWGIRWKWGPGWYVTIPIAAAVACAFGTLGARNGSGGDTRRLAEALVAVVIPLYAMVVLVVDGAPLPDLALGIAAVAVAPIVTKVAVTWPGKHEQALVAASALCAVWAVMVGAVGFI